MSKSVYTRAKVSVVYPQFDIFDFFENLFLEKNFFFLEIFFSQNFLKRKFIFLTTTITFFCFFFLSFFGYFLIWKCI